MRGFMGAAQVGRYEVVRLLATGGMGEVLLARHTGPAGFSKLVVLKRILRHLADDLAFIQMFVNEARTAARLQHPNIVQVFDFGEHEGSYFLAMEYIDGASLRLLHQKSREGGALLPFEVSARVCAEALRGLHHAHTFVDEDARPHAIVHRDISPDNILVSRAGAVKVVDFGVAKPVDSATKTNTVKGKLPYLAPEQVRRAPVDPRTDLYAIGVTLFELVTGRRPFAAESELELLQSIVTVPAPPASSVNPEVPEALDALIARALAKRPEERFANAAEMVRALEAFLASRPGASTPEELGARVSALAGPALRSSELGPLTQGTVDLEPIALDAARTPPTRVTPEAPFEPTRPSGSRSSRGSCSSRPRRRSESRAAPAIREPRRRRRSAMSPRDASDLPRTSTARPTPAEAPAPTRRSRGAAGLDSRDEPLRDRHAPRSRPLRRLALPRPTAPGRRRPHDRGRSGCS